MYIVACILPLIGFILSGVFGFFFSVYGSILITVFNIFLAFILSLFIFYEVVLCNSITSLDLWNWAILDIYCINFGLYFDSLTSVMFVIITGISLCVHFYSIGYMSYDPNSTRFFSYLSLFTFFMLILVSASNFVQMFIGWEGVGVCSYLLINFWFTRILANKAAIKAMVMNRVADVFFFIAIVLFLIIFKTTDFVIVSNLINLIANEKMLIFSFSFYKVDIICFFLFIGAIGKSAQIGFHTWLADAMEGPTPVSALLHAATMVTAGVFLLLRSSFILQCSNIVLFYITLFGAFTAFFFGLTGFAQFDVKKIIAFSTCSQLGYMFFSCGLSNYQIAIFHLFNHAFFKALLFLSAGSIIHALFDEQDIRRMGSLINFLPFTYFCIFLGSVAIMGFPFLTGFYSKDIILELSFGRYIVDGLFIYSLALSAALFTALYSFRLIFYVFLSKVNFFKSFIIHESNFFISLPMFILSICSIFIGYLFSEIFTGFGSFFFNTSFPMNESQNYFFDIEIEFLSPFYKCLPVLLTLWGLLSAIVYVNFSFFINWTFFIELAGLLVCLSNFNLFFFFLESRFFLYFYFGGFFNLFYNVFFINLLRLSYMFNVKIGDKGFLELFGPFGFYVFFIKLSSNLRKFEFFQIFFKIGFFIFIMLLLFFFVNGISNFVIIQKYLHLLIFLSFFYFKISFKNF